MLRSEFVTHLHNMGVKFIEEPDRFIEKACDNEVYWMIEKDTDGWEYSVYERGVKKRALADLSEEDFFMTAFVILAKKRVFFDVVMPILADDSIYEEILYIDLDTLLGRYKVFGVDGVKYGLREKEDSLPGMDTAIFSLMYNDEVIFSSEVDSQEHGLFYQLQLRCYLYALSKEIELNEDVIIKVIETE